jgi:hypothetical protein
MSDDRQTVTISMPQGGETADEGVCVVCENVFPLTEMFAMPEGGGLLCRECRLTLADPTDRSRQ